MKQRLKAERVQFRLSLLPSAWQLEPATGDQGQSICRLYDFGDFANATDFLCTVAAIGLEVNLYPEVRINGGEVFVRLIEPAEGFTDELFDVAEAMDRAAS